MISNTPWKEVKEVDIAYIINSFPLQNLSFRKNGKLRIAEDTFIQCSWISEIKVTWSCGSFQPLLKKNQKYTWSTEKGKVYSAIDRSVLLLFTPPSKGRKAPCRLLRRGGGSLCLKKGWKAGRKRDFSTLSPIREPVHRLTNTRFPP